MATLSDSVKAQLDADWTGAGGTEPTYYVEEDIRVAPPSGQDWVLIRTSSLASDAKPVNDTYIDEKHILVLVVNTLTSEDRLKELSDEVVRILDATTVGNITYQRRLKRQIVSGIDKGVFYYQEEITYDLREQMKSSAAAYGSGTTGDFAVVGDLTVGGDDIKDSSGAVVISFDGAGSIDTLEATVSDLTDTTLTGAYLEDLLMFGSANAAYVPMALFAISEFSYMKAGTGYITNTGADNANMDMVLPIPCNKGSLKLYISNLQFGVKDADALAYITSVFIFGLNGEVATQLDTDATDHKTTGDKTFSGAVMPASAIDVSGYQSVIVIFNTNVNAINELDFGNIRMECYYDT